MLSIVRRFASANTQRVAAVRLGAIRMFADAAPVSADASTREVGTVKW
jgi:hypothetical protein